ncbi:MAG: SgcJ/EcaC family oxidoreductase [Bacteroidota bacterium]
MIKKVEIDPPMKTDATVHQLNEKIQVIHLYQDLLKSWNDRDTDAYTNLFTNDGNIIGFDGSQANGRKEIYSHIEQIFTGHQTGTYISIVQEIRFLTPDLALLRAIAGLVLPGKMDINPGINAIQTLVAQKMEDRFV